VVGLWLWIELRQSLRGNEIGLNDWKSSQPLTIIKNIRLRGRENEWANILFGVLEEKFGATLRLFPLRSFLFSSSLIRLAVAVPMKLTLRPEWRLWPLTSFLGLLDIKTGVTVALLFAVRVLSHGCPTYS